MQETSNVETEVPVWARSGAFPAKPAQQADFGFIDTKGNVHSAQDESDLASKVKHSARGVDLVWTPDSDCLLVPEEIPALHSPLRVRFSKQAEQDISDGKRMGLVLGAMTLWTLYAAWKNSGGQLAALYSHQLTGLASMLLLFFGILPLYEGFKMKRHLARSKASDLAEEIPEAQFEAWLHRQRIPATYFLLCCVATCGLVQVYFDRGLADFEGSIIDLDYSSSVHLSILDKRMEVHGGA